MADWKAGLGGAASGAAAGASLGSVFPGIGTGVGALVGGIGGGLLSLFGGGDDEAEAAARQREELYKNLYNQYLGPDSESQKALARLEELSRTGLTAEDRASAYNLLDQADTEAAGREGAIAQEQAATGRGASSSGLDAALRAGASQAAAKRQTTGELGIASLAEQRKAQALQAYLDQKARNDQMLLSWKLAVTGGQADALKGVQDLAERQNYADTSNLYHGLDSLTTMGLYKAKYGKADTASPVGAAPPAPDPVLATPKSSTRPAATSMTEMPAYNPGGASTAADAAQRYAGGPMALASPRHMDQFGVYDLSPLLDEQYRQ